MHYWLVTNRQAGKSDSHDGFWLRKLEAAGVSPVTECDFHDQDWVEKVAEGDCILAAGGDGSVNRAAALCRDRRAVLAVLPSGTANDFARNLGLPTDADRISKLVAEGQWQWVDAANLDGHIFLNVAHVGLGTWPVRESSGPGKKLLGKFSYSLGLLKKFSAQRGFHATIHCDSGRVRGRWLSIAVATGAFYGGGHQIPEASADDGQLDLIAVRPRSVLHLFTTFLFMRLIGRSPRRNSTVVHLKSHWCHVHTSQAKTVTADGEVFARTPMDVTCEPAALRVICNRIVET